MSISREFVRRQTDSDQGGTMEYMLLIYTPGVAQKLSDEEREAMFAEFGKYSQSLRDSGAFVAGDPLQPPDVATTVRAEGGETLTTDGPFAETKEWLGGYYKVDVESLDEALDWAGKIPSVKYGDKIEVRPVMPIPADSPAGS
jgi:hypothetical protein